MDTFQEKLIKSIFSKMIMMIKIILNQTNFNQIITKKYIKRKIKTRNNLEEHLVNYKMILKCKIKQIKMKTNKMKTKMNKKMKKNTKNIMKI